ncbi:MAG: AraC family transcriptional regulator [Burkholderiaceae bacterium]
MRQLDLAVLPPTSAGAAVARSSHTTPEFLVSADADAGLIAARWRRSHAATTEPQQLDDHLLSYCAAGPADITIVVDGVPTRVHHRLGSTTFVPAGRQVQWTMVAPEQSVHLHLYIPADAVWLSSESGSQPAPVLGSVDDAWIDSYFRLMIAEYEGWTHDDRIDASRFLDETGGLLIRRLAALLSAAQSTPEPSRAGTNRVTALRPFILQRIQAFVTDRLESDIRLETLAELASMSIGHFLRAFHQATGMTPYNYVLERRLDRAGEWLLESSDPVSVIARRCGFGSAAHFSTTFRVHRGCTPSQHRRRH